MAMARLMRPRARNAGAGGEITVRADAGFWSYGLIERLNALGVRWSITVPLQRHIRAAIEAIPETAWQSIDYTETGAAQAAETLVDSPAGLLRLVIRRTRLTGPQATIWPDWRYHAFAADTDLPAAEADRAHRRHASVELAVRNLKEGGLAHLPSGDFNANAVWLACAVLAHNLVRWTKQLGGVQPGELTVGATIRVRPYRISGRVVNHGGRFRLRLPARWPWARVYQNVLANLRGLPQLC